MQRRNLLEDIEQRIDELRLGFDMPRLPACDVVDEGDAFVLTAELPGMDKRDIQIEVDERAVHIKASRTEESKKERKGFVRHERSARFFERTVPLPEEVSADGARATFRNGVVDVRLPKVAPEKKSARPIEIE